MLPWEVLANQDKVIGPARCFGELQVFPPSADGEEPTRGGGAVPVCVQLQVLEMLEVEIGEEALVQGLSVHGLPG